jgi:hypothetical protein
MRPILIAAALWFAAGAVLPFHWTHRLSPVCAWRPEPCIAALGLARGSPDAAADQMRAACLLSRGLKSQSPVNLILRQWPSDMEAINALGGSLSPEDHARHVQGGDRR